MALIDIPYVPLITTHVFLSPISGILLLLAGMITLFRDRNSRINQLFCGFLSGFGLYQIFDGLLYLMLFIRKNETMANLYRDLSIISYLLGLISGALAILSIYHGPEYLSNKRNLGMWGLVSLIVVIIGVFADSADVSAQTQQREVLGWVAIVGTFVVCGVIIIMYQYKLIKDTVNPSVEYKIKNLMIGTTTMILILFVFDITFVLLSIDIIYEILTIDVVHTIIHIIVIGGVGLIVASLWRPLGSD